MHHEHVERVTGDLLSLDPDDLTDAMCGINNKIASCERCLFQSHIHLSRSIRFSRSPNRVDNRPRFDEERGGPSEYPEKPIESQRIKDAGAAKQVTRGVGPFRAEPSG